MKWGKEKMKIPLKARVLGVSRTQSIAYQRKKGKRRE